jgi:hypothetical protein
MTILSLWNALRDCNVHYFNNFRSAATFHLFRDKVPTSELYFHGYAQACIMYDFSAHSTSPTESFRYPFPQHRHPPSLQCRPRLSHLPTIPPTYRNASCLIVAQQTLFIPRPNTTTPERQRKLLSGRKDFHVSSPRL